jgi:hypothetical protein
MLDLLLLGRVIKLLSYNQLFVSDFITRLVISRNNTLNCSFSSSDALRFIPDNKDVLLVFFISIRWIGR